MVDYKECPRQGRNRNGRQIDASATKRTYGPGSREGHASRNGGASIDIRRRLSVPFAQAGFAGPAGPRLPVPPEGDFRKRLLLAPARLCKSKATSHQCQILERQAGSKRRARPRKLRPASRCRLANTRDLGVRNSRSRSTTGAYRGFSRKLDRCRSTLRRLATSFVRSFRISQRIR